MKILLTGATGYIGKRLLPILVSQGHEVVCCVRDKNRFYCPIEFRKNITVIEVDFLKIETLIAIPTDINAAYYLIHSMSGPDENYDALERISAENFVHRIDQTTAKQVIYLSGIVNDKSLSKHLSSRKKVEDVLNNGKFAVTTLRAGIIVGSGSASFEIIRDLVNKLPIMITPKWLNTKCQPIAIPVVAAARPAAGSAPSPVAARGCSWWFGRAFFGREPYPVARFWVRPRRVRARGPS